MRYRTLKRAGFRTAGSQSRESTSAPPTRTRPRTAGSQSRESTSPPPTRTRPRTAGSQSRESTSAPPTRAHLKKQASQRRKTGDGTAARDADSTNDPSVVRLVRVVGHRRWPGLPPLPRPALVGPIRMSLWSALVVSIRGVLSGEHLIRRLCRAHPLPAHSAADLPKRYSLMRSRRQR